MEKLNVKDVEKRSRERIIYLIDNMCNGNRMEFAKKSDIGKSSVSQYVNGTNTPGNITASKIGKAFNVNPMWVMGFDEPMFLQDASENSEVDEFTSTFIDLLKQLSPDKRKEAINYMKYLSGKE